MPGSILHLFVASKISFNIYNEVDGELLLGSISPDSVNLPEYADKKIRWNSHFRKENIDEWLENIIYIYNNVRGAENRMVLGYIIHNLTDALWDKYVQPKIYLHLSGQGFDTENYATQKWKIIDNFEQQLYFSEEFKAINNILCNQNAQDVFDIKADQIEKWKKHYMLSNIEKVRAYNVIKTKDVDFIVSKIMEIIVK